MSQLKINKNTNKLTLVGEIHTFKDLDVVQMQNIMLTLNYEKETLFECLFNMEENSGHNVSELGKCGSFMYSYKGEL